MVGFVFLFYGLIFLRVMLSDRVISSGLGLAGQARMRLGLLGSALTLLAVLYFFATLALVIADFSDFFADIMPQTPEAVFRGLLLLLSTVVLILGVEVLGRVAFIMLPVVVFFILAGILGNTPSLELQNLLPLAEKGPEPIVSAGFMHLSYTSELFALGFLGGSLGYAGRRIRRASYWGLIINFVFFLMISVFLIAVLGEGNTVRSNFKLFGLFRFGLKSSSTGYESLFIVVWVVIFFVKAALLQGAIGFALAEITPFKKGLWHIAAGITVFLVGFYVFDNRISMINFYSENYPAVTIAFTVSFLVLVNLFPGKNTKKSK